MLIWEALRGYSKVAPKWFSDIQISAELGTVTPWQLNNECYSGKWYLRLLMYHTAVSEYRAELASNG